MLSNINLYLDIFLYPLIAGLLLSFIAPPIGAIMIWKRITYFSDAISHAALLGIAFSLLLELPQIISTSLVCIGFAMYINYIKRISKLNLDIIISISTSLFLALAIIIMNISNKKQDLMSYLFGDILLTNIYNIITLVILLIICYAWLWRRWKDIIKIIINEDIAVSEGIDIGKTRLEFIILLSIIIGATIKVVGVLLITSMLLIPATISSRIANSPKDLIIKGVKISLINFIIGYALSFILNQSVSPMVIVVGSVLLLIVVLSKSKKSQINFINK